MDSWFDRSMAAQRVPVTGAVLSWAIADSSSSRAQVAEAVGVSPAALLEWEKEKAQPSLVQFRNLAKKLGRPESFFFLAHPPSTAPVGAAFRSHSGVEHKHTADEARALRLAARLQRVVSWVYAETNFEVDTPPALNMDAGNERAAKFLRGWLGWDSSAVIGGRISDSRVCHTMRSLIQDKGILALQLSIGEGGVRGFSIPHRSAPLVAINTKDHPRARLFSYGHELAHLTLNDEHVCLTKNNRGIESWCNKVAAALLMPADDFLWFMESRLRTQSISKLAQVVAVRNYFHVSLRAAAIRAHDLGVASTDLYDVVDREAEYKGQGGGPADSDRTQTRPRIRLQQYGRGYVNALFDAESVGLIQQHDVLDLLKISRNELSDLREFVASGQEG